MSAPKIGNDRSTSYVSYVEPSATRIKMFKKFSLDLENQRLIPPLFDSWSACISSYCKIWLVFLIAKIMEWMYVAQHTQELVRKQTSCWGPWTFSHATVQNLLIVSCHNGVCVKWCWLSGLHYLAGLLKGWSISPWREIGEVF